jgi:hypothetical protein
MGLGVLDLEALRPRFEKFLGSARSKVRLRGGGMGLKPLAVGAPLDVVADLPDVPAVVAGVDKWLFMILS